MSKDVTYYGFEMTDKERKALTPSTKKILRTLKKEKACTMERDDSPEGYLTVQQLKDIASNLNMTFCTLPNCCDYVHAIIREDAPNISISGD